MKHLAALTKLRVLNLSRTRVSAKGLQHLRGLTNLRELKVNSDYVSEEDVRKLKKQMPQLTVERLTPPRA